MALSAAAVALLSVCSAGSSPAANRAGHYRLTSAGIGDVTFGESPAAVTRSLERLFGPPATPTSMAFCGFEELFWVGLAARPHGDNSDGLTVYFRHGRFVGYAYGPPYGGPQAPRVSRGPMLSTARGLGLGEPVTRGRRLYGTGFVVFSQAQGTPPNPRLDRLPAWQARTATGRLYGFIDQRTIGSISAGAIPNTPCR